MNVKAMRCQVLLSERVDVGVRGEQVRKWASRRTKMFGKKRKKRIRVKKQSKRFLFVETIQVYFYCGVKLSVCVFRNCQ